MRVAPVPLAEEAFDALGATVELFLDADPDVARTAFAAAREQVEELEALLSRFRPASALTRVNATGAVTGEHELARVVRLALDARARTGGRFDPTVHDAVCAWGYDRSFDELGDDARPAPDGAPCGGAVKVDEATGTVRLGEGVRLDLGGIAKGYVVDRVVEELGQAGPCLVSAGGDLAVSGPLAGGVWSVEVETSGDPVALGLPWGALATSGSDVRRWRRGGVPAHHLIDPATGRPSASDLLRVTAAGATAADAEVAAKALLLAGSEAAVQEADALGIPCVLVTHDGRTLLAGGVA